MAAKIKSGDLVKVVRGKDRGKEGTVKQVLKDDPHRVSLFIGGDPHAKLCRVMEKKGLSAEEAIEEIRTVDHQRKAYHNYYCEMKWGDARAYDLTVKSDVLGMEGTAEMLIRYIRAFQEKD